MFAWGYYPQKNLVRVCGPLSNSVTYLRPAIVPTHDLTKNSKPELLRATL